MMLEKKFKNRPKHHIDRKFNIPYELPDNQACLGMKVGKKENEVYVNQLKIILYILYRKLRFMEPQSFRR